VKKFRSEARGSDDESNTGDDKESSVDSESDND